MAQTKQSKRTRYAVGYKYSRLLHITCPFRKSVLSGFKCIVQINAHSVDNSIIKRKRQAERENALKRDKIKFTKLLTKRQSKRVFNV